LGTVLGVETRAKRLLKSWLALRVPGLTLGRRLGTVGGAETRAKRPLNSWLALRVPGSTLGRRLGTVGGAETRAKRLLNVRRRPRGASPADGDPSRERVGSAVMAIGATIHTFTVQLADVDRGVYDELALRVARHPSETDAYMLTRVLAYCLEYEEGIAFSEGISSTDEPAVLVRDLTGRLTAWIEVGAPDADRLHHGSKSAERTVVYTHRDPAKVLAPWAGKRIHRAERIVLHSFDPGFVDAAVTALARRNDVTLSITERQLYLELNGATLTSGIHEHRIE